MANTSAFLAPWMAPAALVVALASLAVNGVLLHRLSRPEQMLEPALDRVATRLQRSDAAIRYTVRIPAGTPVSFDIPVDQRYVVNLRTSLPIDTDVRVPFNTPFGNRVVTIPVRANVPLRQDIPVHIVDTFHLRTQTNAAYTVPLEIKLRDLPMDALRQALAP